MKGIVFACLVLCAAAAAAAAATTRETGKGARIEADACLFPETAWAVPAGWTHFLCCTGFQAATAGPRVNVVAKTRGAAEYAVWSGVSATASCPPTWPTIATEPILYRDDGPWHDYVAGLVADPSWPVYGAFLAVRCVRPCGAACNITVEALVATAPLAAIS